MKKINLPSLDHDGNITPHLAAALAAGNATADNHPSDPDQIVVTFDKLAHAKAFLKAIGKPESEVAEPEAPLAEPEAPTSE